MMVLMLIYMRFMRTMTWGNKNMTKQSTGFKTFLNILPIIGLLWLFFFLRLHDIADSLLFFVDETRHIERAQIIWSFSDLHTSTTPGKFLLYYWIGAFGLPDHETAWLARTPVALFAVVGAAGTFALARLLFSRFAGLLSIAILAVFPFMLFYERLSLH